MPESSLDNEGMISMSETPGTKLLLRNGVTHRRRHVIFLTTSCDAHTWDRSRHLSCMSDGNGVGQICSTRINAMQWVSDVVVRVIRMLPVPPSSLQHPFCHHLMPLNPEFHNLQGTPSGRGSEYDPHCG